MPSSRKKCYAGVSYRGLVLGQREAIQVIVKMYLQLPFPLGKGPTRSKATCSCGIEMIGLSTIARSAKRTFRVIFLTLHTQTSEGLNIGVHIQPVKVPTNNS